MLRLAIIADDLTGALDTGIKFAKMGIPTQVITDYNFCEDTIDPTKEILVIDTETRHVHESEAYARVYKSVKLCANMGFDYFYKKTDSALRGHIGSELAALYDVVEHPIAFIPALPEENRVTRDGIHYINGIPVAESIFGHDSLNPVRHSDIRKLIFEETSLSVKNVSPDQRKALPDKQINIYDAGSQEDLKEIADHLQQKDLLRVTAGCAGFAGILASTLPFTRHPVQPIPKTDQLFVLCGSINDVTKKQIDYAMEQGIARISLTQEQKLTEGYLDTEEGACFLKNLEESCREKQILILDVFSENTVEDSRTFAAASGFPPEEIPDRIACCLGKLGKYILSFNRNATLLIVGGDTLYSFLQKLDKPLLDPICEPVIGTAAMMVSTKYHRFPLISKSGGFGQEDLMIELAKIVLSETDRPSML